VAATEPVVFSTVADGARRAFGARLTPDLFARLKAVGFDLQDVQAAYSLAPFLDAIRLLASEFFPGEPPAEQYRRLGHEFMVGYQQTALGLAVLTMGRVVGLKRTLLRMGRNLHTTGNYIDVDAREVGPKEVHVTTRIRQEFRGIVTPGQLCIINGYRVGVFEATFEALGGRGEAVMDGPPDRPDVVFQLRWE